MRKAILFSLIYTCACNLFAGSKPITTSSVVFEEVDGVVAVEAEHFFKQTDDRIRGWHLFSKNNRPKIDPDAPTEGRIGADRYADAVVAASPASR